MSEDSECRNEVFISPRVGSALAAAEGVRRVRAIPFFLTEPGVACLLVDVDTRWLAESVDLPAFGSTNVSFCLSVPLGRRASGLEGIHSSRVSFRAGLDLWFVAARGVTDDSRGIVRDTWRPTRST